MKIFSLTGIAVLFVCISIAGADQRIADIRKEYQAIRGALPTYTQESLELTDYSTEGGVAKAFRDAKGNIRFIRVELYFESGKEFDEYYYRNGLLIFVFYEHHRYNVPFNVSQETAKELGIEPFDPKKTKITEDRYYFDNGAMIKWLDEEKKDVNKQSKEFRDATKEVIDFSNEMLAKFKRKD
ncbi:MAG: hypothetical protein ACM34I_07680 [bacterium]